MILLVDNYDSFTFNLAQYLGELGQGPIVRRNNELTIGDIEAMRPERIAATASLGVQGPGEITIPVRSGKSPTTSGTVM